MSTKLAGHLALAQILHFTLALAGFIGLLFVIVLGWAHLDGTSEKLAYTMLGVLGTIVTQQAGFFYQRQRETPADTPPIPAPAPETPK